ncbi:MAG: hypothetical protein HY901_31755 [Deltaproteobacteria bacterium]|nr:hypothetical protein [Deltaproteobacteria bacterium]
MRSPSHRLVTCAAVLWLAAALLACEEPPAGSTTGSDGSTSQDSGADAAQEAAADARLGGPDATPEVPVDAGEQVSDGGIAVADAAMPAADTGSVTTPFAGQCEAAFPGTPTGTWRHPTASAIVVGQGGPNHRARDLVVSPGEQVSVRAHFTYGVMDKDLQDEDVEVWLRRCPDWMKLATLTTDTDGVVMAAMPADLPKGEYRLRFLVMGDGASTDGVLAVWPAGTQAIVTDIDGTLTTSDWQAVQDVVGLGEADMYPDANAVMLQWAAKGYRLLYLTGRPQVVSRYTREWVEARGFPPGPVQLNDDLGTFWPLESNVQEFKAGRLTEIAGKGVFWRVAYGNATTDIGAYAETGIPKADTFIIGEHAGEEGTVAVSSYAEHLPVAAAYPDAVQP